MEQSKKTRPKEKGFTLIEMLVVLVILGFLAVVLTESVRAIVVSFERVNRMASVKAQAQEASQYLTKVARMSDFVSITSASSSNPRLNLNWRKPTSTSYTQTPITICRTGCTVSLEDFFEGNTITSVHFEGEGSNGYNRVMISFKIMVEERSSDELIEVPFQSSISLRSYAVY